jgi:hypothetical protein
VLRKSRIDAYGQPRVECLLAAQFTRAAFEQVKWDTADSGTIVQDASSEILSAPLPRLGLMADNSLSVRDREFFLAEPHVAALSVSAGQGRGPFTVPIWYQYAPGGEAWVLTEARSRKVRLIETAGRFTLMVERVIPTTWYVSVEGPVIRTVPGTDALLREIAARYLPPDKVPAYIEFAKADMGEQVAIYLRPERWLTADLGPGAVPPAGDLIAKSVL